MLFYVFEVEASGCSFHYQTEKLQMLLKLCLNDLVGFVLTICTIRSILLWLAMNKLRLLVAASEKLDQCLSFPFLPPSYIASTLIG